jgi:hypothetical protein
MSAPVRPDEFAKYAPRWLREGTVRPRDPTGLPPAPQLPPALTSEPPWRGPSPFEGEASDQEPDDDFQGFDGDVRQWRAQPDYDRPDYDRADYDQPDYDQHGTTLTPIPIYEANRLHVSLAGKIFGTTAAFSCAVILMGALGLLFFPSASREAGQAQNKSNVTTVAPRAIEAAQQDSAGKSRVSDMWPSSAVSSVNKTSSEAPSAPAAPAAPSASAASPSQFANAVYVVANADASTLPVTRSQPQQAPEPQPAPAVQAPPATPQPAAAQPVAVQSAPAPRSVPVQRIVALPPQPAANGAEPGTEDIDRMVKRGESFFAQGDVTAARVLLERAAEAHDARAALALGSTYDPNVLKKMGAVGFKPDREQARNWYVRAAEYGSPEARQRLSALAQASN